MVKKLFILVLCLLFAVPAGARDEEKVGALGRIEPMGGLVHLMGPPGDKIAEIKAKEGDVVKKGVLLVLFESHTICQLEVAQAELACREADEGSAKAIALQELKLREADELGKKAIAGQEQRNLMTQAEYDFALKRLDRYEGIEGQSLSALQMDERKSQVKITQARLAAGKLELERLVLSRELSVALARHELGRLTLNRQIGTAQARDRLDLAKEKLKQSVLRAPSDGTVLEIHLNMGESTGGKPVITMADLECMVVTAEIFEGDLLKISPGKKVTITSTALPGPLNGEVEFVGRIISGSSRTGKVRVRLMDAKDASRLINMEVDVSIKL